MGLSAKPVGKKKGIMKKMQNELDKKTMDAKARKGRVKK